MRERAEPYGFVFSISCTVLIRAAAVLMILLASRSPGHSELLVEGSRDNLVVTAQQAPLGLVVEALGTKFGVHLKSQAPLSEPITGRYAGSLLTVLKRLLYHYDFVIALAGNDTVVTIVRETSSSDIPRLLVQPALPPRVRQSDSGH